MRNFCQVLHSCVRLADMRTDRRLILADGRTTGVVWSGASDGVFRLSFAPSKENILPPPSDPKSVYGPRHHDSRPTQKGQSATSTTYNWRGFGEMKCMKQGSKVITDGPRFMTGLVTFTPFERKGCPRGKSSLDCCRRMKIHFEMKK